MILVSNFHGESKWILYKHTSNLEIVTQTAVELQASSSRLTKEDRRGLLGKLKAAGLYRARNPEEPLDSIQHRINTLIWYMFGYRDGVGKESRFVFGPLGNLFLRHLHEPDAIRKIMFTMLWGKQYPDMFGTPAAFNLYPFRLLFVLLNDPRLDKKMSGPEFAHCVSKTREVNAEIVESLVLEILSYRNLTTLEKHTAALMQQHHYVNAYHEWEYVTKFLESFGVLVRARGTKLFTLNHGTYTKRAVFDGLVRMHPKLEGLFNSFTSEYPVDEKPIQINDPERLKIDAIKEIYSFCPPQLIVDLGLDVKSPEYQLIQLPRLLRKWAANEDDGASEQFEIELANALNFFVDVEAVRIGGPGNTDVECRMLPNKKKFAVEGKSTQTKLSALNAGRLRLHREKISAEYTIVVTPAYTPSVLTDITASPTTILLVSTFAEYLYNLIVADTRGVSYADMDQIVLQHLGSDMSEALSGLTVSLFAATANPGEIVDLDD